MRFRLTLSLSLSLALYISLSYMNTHAHTHSHAPSVPVYLDIHQFGKRPLRKFSRGRYFFVLRVLAFISMTMETRGRRLRPGWGRDRGWAKESAEWKQKSNGTNENGLRWKSFAVGQKKSIRLTKFGTKAKSRLAWMSPGGRLEVWWTSSGWVRFLLLSILHSRESDFLRCLAF